MLDYEKLIHENSKEENGFIYPDWEALAGIVEKSCSEEHFDEVFNGLAMQWLGCIKNSLDGDYKILESENFFVLCDEEAHVQKNLVHSCGASLKIILDQFAGALSDDGYGRHVVIVFDHQDEYHRYGKVFYGGDDSPASGGGCIYSGYTHIVLPPIVDNETPVATIAHELTHALLAQYLIPNWLNEALAMRMEDIVMGYDGLVLDQDSYNHQVQYWNENNIQEFWSGEVWGKATAGFDLSYVLARVLWRKIAVDLNASKKEIVEFIETLNIEDSGSVAFKNIFDCSLGELVEEFLGEGNWGPDRDRMKLTQGNPSKDIDQSEADEEIQNISNLLFSLRYGRITRGHMDGKHCVMDIETDYLPELVNPDFECFTVTFDHFCSFEYYSGDNEEDVKVGGEGFSLTEFIDLKPTLTGAEILKGRVHVSVEVILCSKPDLVSDVKDDKISGQDGAVDANFAFCASGVSVRDPEARKWSMEEILKLEDEYWSGE